MGIDTGYISKTIGGGLVSLVLSFFYNQFRSARRKQALDLGKQLMDLTVARHEAVEKAKPVSAEDKQKFIFEINTIWQAVYSEFRKNDNSSLELLPRKIPVKVLVVRILLGAMISLGLAVIYGAQENDSTTQLIGCVVAVGSAAAWLFFEYRVRVGPHPVKVR
jgi:hypothetical protein